MEKYIFFSGKGGVGKTTTACATAIHLATKGKKTLIVSTDPASNLSDVFEMEIGHRITAVAGLGGLHAIEIDPETAAFEYKEAIIAPFRGVMPEEVIASMDEQLSGPCTTEMAAFDRFIDYMETDEYEIIVFDTAPTGHTIRLLELPVDWSRHIEDAAKGSGQTCLGPVQTIQDSKDRYDRATELLKDTEITRFVFVMRPEELSLYETVRATRELETIGIRAGELVINGILPEEVCDAGFFRRKWEVQQGVIKKIEAEMATPVKHLLLKDGEVKGIQALTGLSRELFDLDRPSWKIDGARDAAAAVIAAPEIDNLFTPDEKTKSIFFTGKGGVGKTVISCVTALDLADRGIRTLLVTTDPAAHTGQVLGVDVGSEPVAVSDNLFAVMVDQDEALREYKSRILDEAKGKFSEETLVAMEEEMNSPCTEEMAAFDRFISFIEGADYEVIVFDTAPTGHTLRLLDLPFEYAKQVEMMVGSGDNGGEKDADKSRFAEVIATLRDKSRTVFCLVLYPENAPIEESFRSMKDLEKAGIKTQLVVANMILEEDISTNHFFRRKREMQLIYLGIIRERFGLPVLRFPLMEEEIRGLDTLRAAAEHLGVRIRYLNEIGPAAASR